MEKEQHSTRWQVLMILSIVLGTVVTFITIYRHALLPSLYAGTHHQQQPAHEAEHVAVPIKEDSSRQHPAVTEQEPVTERKEDANPVDAMPSVDRRYLLIAGSFSSEENAVRYQAQLESAQIHASLLIGRQGAALFRVVVGSADSLTEIAHVKRRLADGGLKHCWVFKRQSDE